MRKVHFATLVTLFLGACSTAPVVPDVAKFGKTVAAIGTADSKTPSAKSLPGRVAAARRADFAAKSVVYELSDPSLCAYTGQQLNLVNANFADQCKLIPKQLKDGELIVVASQYDSFADQKAAQGIIDAENTDLLKEHLGYGIRNDLIAYAKALNELATTTEPAKLGSSTGAAFDALTGLKDTVSSAANAAGEPAPASRLRTPSKTFFSLLATEVAETMRYRRLKALVEYADPFVQAASDQLTVLTYQGEGASFEKKSDTLRDFVGDAEPGEAASLKLVEDAYKSLLDADSKARFRAYSEIGRTHEAILSALNAPADFDRLADANARIINLAEALKNFAEAL